MAQSDWANIISARAPAYNLDPVAALAVAMVEGLSGGVGDQGTSFGPFQLHEGGALPAGRGQAWAESPAGIEYALRSMAGAGAAGLHGPAAIQAIVRNFERPAAPDAEIARALAAYGQAGKLGGGTAMPQMPLPPPSQQGAPAAAAPDFRRSLALALLNSNQSANDPGFYSALSRAGAASRVPAAFQAPAGTLPASPQGLAGTFSSPFKAGWKFGRVDQGVDYTTSSAIHAPLDGVVTRIDQGWAGGTGKAVVVRFHQPITIGGRTYDGFYSAETNPLVGVGARVSAGTPLTTGGSGEIGLTINGQPARLVGGLGAGTRPTQAGQDLLTLLQRGG